jgi:hypothetical protein
MHSAVVASLQPDTSAREIGHLAVWSVTTAKPGNGVELLRDGREVRFSSHPHRRLGCFTNSPDRAGVQWVLQRSGRAAPAFLSKAAAFCRRPTGSLTARSRTW